VARLNEDIPAPGGSQYDDSKLSKGGDVRMIGRISQGSGRMRTTHSPLPLMPSKVVLIRKLLTFSGFQEKNTGASERDRTSDLLITNQRT